MSSRRQFFVVDPQLRDLVGHYFTYDYSLMAPAKDCGFEFVVFGHKNIDATIRSVMPVRRTFSRDIWDGLPRIRLVPRVGRELETMCANLLFYVELRRALRPGKLSPESVVFCHMITPRQLLAWSWWVRRLSPRAAPRVALLFRYSADWFRGSRATTAAFRGLEVAAETKTVRLCTDSERLAADYTRLTRLPVEVVPIPHTEVEAGGASGARRRHGALRLVSLGNARDEKGFLEILGVIRLMRESHELEGFKFILQANRASADIRSAIAETGGGKNGQVAFIYETLTPEEYYGLLLDGDVVLLPYWRSIYRSRTSGVFVEAVAAGKPVIVTEDTWMSDQLRRYGAGLCCRDRDPVSLREKIHELSSSYDQHLERAIASRKAWREKHNPHALISALTQPAVSRGKPARSEITKVAVLYPWNDIRQPSTGAGRRARLLVDYLSGRYRHVRVLSADGLPPSDVGNVEFVSYRSSRLTRLAWRIVHRIGRLVLYAVTLGESRGEDFMLSMHYRHFFEPALRRRIAEIVGWADAVFLEYTFWARPVLREGRRRQAKVIISDYDVVANQIRRSLLVRKWVQDLEADALRQASHAVCVSPEDLRAFEEVGVNAILIRHPVVIREGETGELSPAERRMAYGRLHRRLGVELSGQSACLFVGSYFGPNVVAAERMRQCALELSARYGSGAPRCIVAGRCRAPEVDGNFVATGEIAEEALRDLYAVADLVVIPLGSGTGASVKAIEAMAYGKPVLGTSVAFRGYPVIGGVHCVICDDVSAYPDLIRRLLDDVAWRRALAEAARAFARDYDYRVVYRRYVELIGDTVEDQRRDDLIGSGQ